MSLKHQSSAGALSALQPLGADVRQLRIEAVTRLLPRRGGWLAVREGRAWLTLGDGRDHVLKAGEGAWLPRGATVVVEPWRAGQPVQLVWGEPQPQDPAHATPSAQGIEAVHAAPRGTALGGGTAQPAQGSGLRPWRGVPALAREVLRGWLRTGSPRSAC
jgi:Protein of unknown function (DUF2917)